MEKKQNTNLENYLFSSISGLTEHINNKNKLILMIINLDFKMITSSILVSLFFALEMNIWINKMNKRHNQAKWKN